MKGKERKATAQWTSYPVNKTEAEGRVLHLSGLKQPTPPRVEAPSLSLLRGYEQSCRLSTNDEFQHGQFEKESATIAAN
jgi:hypothetical protein